MPNNLENQWKEYQRLLREDPLKAGLIAFSTGLLFSLFPVHRLVGLVLRVVLAAVKPALLVLGGIKAYEFAQQYTNKGEGGAAS